MKKVILKVKTYLDPDTSQRIEEEFKRQFEEDGFIVVDDHYDVIVFDDGREEE